MTCPLTGEKFFCRHLPRCSGGQCDLCAEHQQEWEAELEKMAQLPEEAGTFWRPRIPLLICMPFVEKGPDNG